MIEQDGFITVVPEVELEVAQQKVADSERLHRTKKTLALIGGMADGDKLAICHTIIACLSDPAISERLNMLGIRTRAKAQTLASRGTE